MFAVKDKESGKFLKAFSGSYNDARWKSRCRLKKALGVHYDAISSDQVHAELFSLDTPLGAKIYQTRAGAAQSFYSYRFRKVAGPNGFRRRLIPLSEACPWLEVVEVQLQVVPVKEK